MSQKYFGSFSDYNGMLECFIEYPREGKDVLKLLKQPIPTAGEVLFASYGGADYEGDAVVVFRKGGTLYEVHGSHCSCNGLEDQWEPEETTVAALAMRKPTNKDKYYYFLSEHEPEAQEAFWRLVDRLQKEN